jgi:hypothetical protein
MKRKLFLCAVLCLLMLPVISQAASQEYTTAYDYMIRFYPRWFSWVQSNLAQTNVLAGPNGMGPEFKLIVAVNDDTIYTMSFLDLSNEPQILTIPPYSNSYSILILDVFGSVIGSGSMPPTTDPTRYALIGPNYTGTLPDGINPVPFPYNTSLLLIRADKYSHDGADLTQAANAFRAAIQLKDLTSYIQNPDGGNTIIAPLSLYSMPVKRTADTAIFTSPTDFLNTLQEAMAAPNTEPLTVSDKILIAQFNSSFNAAKQQTNDPYYSSLTDINQGAQAAFNAIVDRWRSHTGPTNWVHFDNIGYWGENYLDRAALAEYILYGNNSQAAYYAHAFVDENNFPLDGNYAYTITFAADNMPDYSRFFSVTAYTPDDIELVENSYNKYLVASYTPDLVVSADGSITIYAQSNPPTTAPIANWLPVPVGPFNLMLRVYGPKGSALDGSYIPPGIEWKIGGGY